MISSVPKTALHLHSQSPRDQHCPQECQLLNFTWLGTPCPEPSSNWWAYMHNRLEHKASEAAQVQNMCKTMHRLGTALKICFSSTEPEYSSQM